MSPELYNIKPLEPGKVEMLYCDNDTWVTYTQTWTDTRDNQGKRKTYFQFFMPKLNAFRCTCDAFAFHPALRTYPGEYGDEHRYNYMYLGTGVIQDGCKHTDAALGQIDGLAREFHDCYLTMNWFEASA